MSDKNNNKTLTLEDLGYDDFFASRQKELGFAERQAARVIAEHREAYTVQGVRGEYFAKITGKQLFNASKREDYPAVGDWVIVDESDDEHATIRAILPRRSVLKKKYSNKQETQVIAANVDTVFVVESVDRDYNLNRFERYFVLAREGNILPAIILNKIDLISEEELGRRTRETQDRFGDIDVILTSTIAERGLLRLADYIKRGKTYCFLGSSGVGKSSLINTLIGKEEIRTSEISSSTGKGKHTTTTREMYVLDSGGIVIDNPGTREVGIADAPAGIENVFDEITRLSKECRYADCAHTHRPGCAVLEAVERGILNKNKYENYIKLKKEAEYFRMTDIERREKDRKFGKFVKKALEQLKDIER